jgi:hypothetical protein
VVVAYLDVARAARRASEHGSPAEAALLGEIADRKLSVQQEQDRFADLCDRFDNLYYANTVLEHAGASHWAEHSTATTPGKSHISVNSPAGYVDIPASLQSVPPIINMLAVIPSEEGRQMAAMTERLFHAWQDEEDFNLLTHMACTVKSLYGRTAAKVFWDEETQHPKFRIVDQPRNLYLGWGNTDYTRLNWALYTYRLTPESVYEDWGLEVQEYSETDGSIYPFVLPSGVDPFLHDERKRPWLGQMNMEVEVYDYWYRRPKPSKRRKKSGYGPVEHETWNCIFVGNVLVKEQAHPEYEGKIPYVPLFNTYVPGVPDGKPELYDIEPLIREKDERLSQGAQLIAKVVDGQFWQLVGPEAPDVAPANAMPKANRLTTPGAGNRIEAINPWFPEFQLEQYLTRIDREMADVSGLNDLLRGLAPGAVLSSGKAINALVSNYEARIRIKRDLFYRWIKEVWNLTATVWASKTPSFALLFASSRLDLVAPSLSPRDDMETASMAGNLVNSKLWSQKRGMDRVGVDDPEAEEDVIKAERTDAAMFPADVQVMAQLMVMLQQLGLQPPAEAQAQAGAQAQSLANYRALGGGQAGSPAMNGPDEQPVGPPETQPGNTPEGEALGGPPAPLEGGTSTSQTLVQNGEASNRILSNQPL